MPCPTMCPSRGLRVREPWFLVYCTSSTCTMFLHWLQVDPTTTERWFLIANSVDRVVLCSKPTMFPSGEPCFLSTTAASCTFEHLYDVICAACVASS